MSRLNLTGSLLNAMRMAPSPHNTQPWRFRIGQKHLDIFVRRSRLVEAVDPSNEVVMHGIGAAVENALLTLEQFGFVSTLSLSEEFSTEKAVASIAWDSATPVDFSEKPSNKLFHLIDRRQTSRLPYRVQESLAEDLLSNLRCTLDPGFTLRTLDTFQQPQNLQKVRLAVLQATLEQLRQKDIAQELYQWLRFSPKDPLWLRDGLNAACMGWGNIRSLAARMLLHPRTLSLLFRTGLASLVLRTPRLHVPATPCMALLTHHFEDNRVGVQIQAGRNLQRLWLSAASVGLHCHPVSAAIMRPGPKQKMHELFKLERHEHTVNIFRLGYSTKPPQSPRLPKKEIILKGEVL